MYVFSSHQCSVFPAGHAPCGGAVMSSAASSIDSICNDHTTAVSMFSLQVSLLLWSAGAFSAPVLPADDGGNFFQHRIVDHVDQLQQWRRRPPYEYVDSSQERGDPTPAAAAAVMVVPPPHLFRLPAPGGGVCLIVDENGAYHAVRDAFPPLGLPVSETGVVDSQVNAIGDTLFGTRFQLSDGTVRGPWCPGGTAGPLLRIARHLPRRLLERWAPFRRLARLTPAEDPRARPAVSVLTVTQQPDGSLTVALPMLSATSDGGASDANRDAARVRAAQQDVAATRGESLPTNKTRSWPENCGLAGYDH